MQNMKSYSIKCTKITHRDKLKLPEPLYKSYPHGNKTKNSYLHHLTPTLSYIVEYDVSASSPPLRTGIEASKGVRITNLHRLGSIDNGEVSVH